jgi:hypothetical protein
MRENDVQDAINARLDPDRNPEHQLPPPIQRFTLSALNPEDSGSKQGWRITQVETPGRMARLEVDYSIDRHAVKVKTSQVIAFQIERLGEQKRVAPLRLEIDAAEINLNLEADFGDESKVIQFEKTREGWQLVDKDRKKTSRPMGPMIRFLSSSGPVQIVVPTDCPQDTTQQYLSIARRYSSDSYLYGRVDAIILLDTQAFDETGALILSDSNVLLLGGPTINSVSRSMTASQTVIRFIDGSNQFMIRDRVFGEGTTLLTMFPHPFQGRQEDSGEKESLLRQPIALLLHGTDPSAIERGYSLLPVRTGALLPEWLVVDKTSEWKGYGGVIGAGWFDHAWAWSDAMSYLS